MSQDVSCCRVHPLDVCAEHGPALAAGGPGHGLPRLLQLEPPAQGAADLQPVGGAVCGPGLGCGQTVISDEPVQTLIKLTFVQKKCYSPTTTIVW